MAKKIATIVGNRPQYIKTTLLSPAIREFAKEVYINTGQHYDEMAQDIPIAPDYELDVGSMDEATQLGVMIEKLSSILQKEKPELVLVYGDTNTTLAGALTAAKLKIPIAHIEAGLRAYYDLPEEQNRRLVDHLSTFLFCPTKLAVKNLKKEGLKGIWTGDVMVDLVKGKWESRDYTLATFHRQENVDNKEKLQEIITYLQGKKVIWPLHPRTYKRIFEDFFIDIGDIKLIEPIGFKAMIELERHAKQIITDSGGVQREAHILGVPCEVWRINTEWDDLDLGKNPTKKIVGILKKWG